MSSNTDPSRPRRDDDFVHKSDAILREHTPSEPDLETGDDDFPALDRDPANPLADSGHPVRKQRAHDEQLDPELEVEAGLDAAEDEAQEAGQAASEDDLNR